MPFFFDAVELCIVTINEKHWTQARVVCRALGYGKATKATHVIKAHVNPDIDVHKWQLSSVSAASTISWPKDSQKYNIYIIEEGIYELLFSSQQPKAKDFRKH